MSGKPGRSGRLSVLNPDDPTTLRFAPLTQLPPKPEFASADAAALWDQVVRALHGEGKLSEADLAMLQSTCEMWGLYRVAVAKAVADPLNREARIATVAYWSKFENGAARFGLNPCDRQRIKTGRSARTVMNARDRNA